MIREVAGDLLLSEVEAIAHGVAPNDHFDQGLALALREKWPAMARTSNITRIKHIPSR